jgi:carboxyl-terminal processing protease
MKRYFKITAVGLAVIAALALTVSKRGPAMMIGIGRTTGAASVERKAYDLNNSLNTFKQTLGRILEAYVDPTRLDPKQMLLAALDSIQKQVAEVMVEPFPDQNRIVVHVDTAIREFRIDQVDSPWAMSPKMQEIFQFITQHLLPGTDAEALRNIEYAATNGMLSTLDPHSLLLDPQTYNEMKTSTSGRFGGLGIVIGIRKNALTVIRPMKDTPAWEAGVRKGDRITRIEKDLTQNMALTDAVSRLRGDPGSKVEVWFERDGDKAPRRLVLTRAEIHVHSVTSHVLPSPAGNIGYIRLSQFSQKSDEDMRNALEDLTRKQNIRGLILDVRHNPGGLLDKAIKIADEFLEAGTIVTTVGYANKRREETRADSSAQPRIPMAVLVDGQSASASEIVAGALKNLDRAVLIGSRTFGKGSVQVLMDNPDGSALKLTIAQYLTPGDVSIQSVGITPDVVLEPMSVEKDRLSLFATYKGTREQDLDAHLTSQNTRNNDKPIETLRYIWTDLRKKPPVKQKTANPVLTDSDKKQPPVPGEDDEDDADDAPPDDDDTFVEDFDIQYARDLLAAAKGWRRHEVLASSKDFFAKRQASEMGKLIESLKKYGVDWSPVGQQSAPPSLVASVTTDKPGHSARAGDTIRFTATVTNRGTGVAGQVRAQLKSDNYLYEEREFIFGRIAPGETKSWTIPVKVPKDTLPRQDLVKVVFAEENNQAPTAQALQVRLDGMDRPRFAYSYQFIDDLNRSNGDGLLQRGESVRLRVLVKNTGPGKAMKPYAMLRNLSGDGVLVNKGRFELDPLNPNEERAIDFTFDVLQEFSEPAARVELQVYDYALHEGVTDKLTFNIVEPGVAAREASGVVQLTSDQVVRAGANSSALPVGKAKAGARFQRTKIVGEFARIELEPGRPGFVPVSATTASTQPPSPGAMALSWQVTPPLLEVKNPPLAVTQNSIRLSGVARDGEQVIDAYIVVSNRVSKIEHRKVFYRSNRNGSLAKEMQFDANVPLWPGVNVVTVVARQSGQVQSMQSLVINRLGGDKDKDASVRAMN